MIVCAGDALIDFVPVPAPSGATAFEPRVGGAVLNAATALRRLGAEVAFMGGLSTDLFGDLLMRHLKAEGIGTDLVTRTDNDATLAFVTLDGGEARYAFYDRTSAGRRWAGPEGPLPDMAALHLGSVTLIENPAVSAYAALAERVAGKAVVSLDPNCRPGLIRDPATYRGRIARIAAVAHIVRMSEEDFAYLYPDADEEPAAQALMSGATRLVLISRGEGGASAYWAGGRMDVAARAVRVADTIGAGDTFHAGVLRALQVGGRLSPAGLGGLAEAEVAAALDYATAAAALNCTRSGCNPPTGDEVAALAL